MDFSDAFLQLICSPWLPARLVRALLAALSSWQARRQLGRDRCALRAGEEKPRPEEPPLYLLDGFHGGIPFWDWILLPKGGLWEAVLWPAIGEVVARRAIEFGLPAVLELDGYTYREMATRQPRALALLARAVAAGALEAVNGTYAQPFLDTLSGEAAIRQFSLGLEAIEEALAAPVRVYACQEPCFAAQLPQLLAGFGLKFVLLRTHWAPFGCEPACDAALVRWVGPDGSWVLAVPRHSWMDYAARRDVQPGALRGNISGAHISQWEAAALRGFAERATKSGTEPCLLSKLEDLAPPHAPTPQAAGLATAPDLRLTTLAEYGREALMGREPQEVDPWDLPGDALQLALPWGLEGDALAAAIGRAEAALLTAERVDALAWAMGAPSQEARLRQAWEQFLLAQHHDLQVCGPWLSRRHGKPMSAVGCDLCAVAETAAREVIQRGMEGLLARVDSTGCRGQALLAFNPEGQARRVAVRVPALGQVFDGERELPAQADGGDTVFVCELPALGWRLFDLREGLPPASETGKPAPFRNPFYEAELACDGGLTIWVGGQAVVERGATLCAWSAGEWWDSRRAVRELGQTAGGPVFTRWRVRGSLGPLPFTQELTLWHLLPRIDVSVWLDFGRGMAFGPQPEDGAGYYADDERKLCACFAAGPGQVLRGTPFLVQETGLAQFVGVGWAAVERDGVGLTLVDRGARGYTYDRSAGLLRRVLAWSPRGYMYASADSVTPGQAPWTILRGPRTFGYTLVPYRQRAPAVAEALALPAEVAVGSPRAGAQPGLGSLLAVEPEAVRLTALWVQGGAAYARLWNAGGAPVEAELRAAGEPALQAVDLRLRGGEPLAGRRVPLRPWGVQTVRIAGLIQCGRGERR